jgi:hypothetical protein
MPKEYKECIKSEVANGKALKTAQRICAISYYKRHGKTPQHDESKATFSDYELALFDVLPLIDDALADKKPNKAEK